MECVEYWRGLHVDLHHTHTALAGGRGRHKHVATLGRVGWRAGWGGWQGQAAGRVLWRAGWGGGQGGVAGRLGWRAWSGGGQGGRKGMDLRSKEYSGVNIVT